MYLKKISKLIFLIILLIISFVILEMISYSPKYINKSSISFEITNVRNPQAKKIVRFVDNLYAFFLVKFIKKHQAHLYQNNTEYKDLPDNQIIIGKKDNFTKTVSKVNNNLNTWKRSHGNHSSNRFSDLKIININNIKNLDLAWRYKFSEIKNDIQANPIIAEDKIYLPTTGKEVVALNAVTGEESWRIKTKGTPARRGLVYWTNGNLDDSKIYFCAEKELISINPKNGSANKEFGDEGIVKLKKRCKVSPAIIKNKLVIATVEPALEVYNLKDGKLLWKFYLKLLMIL